MPLLAMDQKTNRPAPAREPTPSPDALEYLRNVVNASEAIAIFRFSRTGYFQFANKHDIQRLTCHRVHLGDIVRGFEEERTAFSRVPSSIAFHTFTREDADAYAKQLLKFDEVIALLGSSRLTFWRMRQGNRIPVLSAHFVHAADVVAELERRRRSPQSVPGSNGKGRRPRKPSKRSVTQSASETDKAA